jgi:AbrB family looped-hinge helix DNA binding protein
MALLKLRRFFQLTLPAELRKQFHLAEGDYLEAEAVEQGILLKPVRVVERKKAREGAGKVRDRVQATLPPHQKRSQEQEGEAR